jgi:hypothetical protein
MIAEIVIRTEYGKQYPDGHVAVIDADKPQSVFAHSKQDAMEWIARYPLFAGAEVDFDSTISQWIDYDDPFPALFGDDNPRQVATHTRQVATIICRNTIHESAGYRYQPENA